MRTARIAILTGLTVFAVGACSNNAKEPLPESTTPTTTHPSIAVTVSPAPQQRNNSGRPAVTFDPCIDIGDATIQKLGFNPDTRKRNDLTADSYTFLGCDFGQKDPDGLTVRSLDIKATNLTLQDFRERKTQSSNNTTVAGRDAVVYTLVGATASITCFIAMDSPVGVIDLQLDLNPTKASGRPCDQVRDIAEKLQPDLPKK
ncbi:MULTISPECIES: DUF3558 domain-containing protein [unclassified Nocardia]|uniref:DUF3558 domain-containing protein n=1 Tax=unclassified Nocardia TaxID=2637762 RepID=UPI001CE41FE2|nr:MULTISPECIES: DUF3558 domain-containing protein [unclassified Nocardia]